MSAVLTHAALGDEIRSRPTSVLAVPDHLELASRIPDLHRCLTLDERRRYDGMSAASRRAEFLIGRALLRAGAAAVLGIRPRSVPFRIAPLGKLSISTRRFRRSLHVSVSHCDSLLLVGFSSAGSIGVDAENAVRCADRVVDRFFDPRERDALAALPAEDRARAFRRAWAVKEACAKALGGGIFAVLPDYTGLGQRGKYGEISWRVLFETEQVATAVAIRSPAAGDAFPDSVIATDASALSTLLEEVLDG